MPRPRTDGDYDNAFSWVFNGLWSIEAKIVHRKFVNGK